MYAPLGWPAVVSTCFGRINPCLDRRIAWLRVHTDRFRRRALARDRAQTPPAHCAIRSCQPGNRAEWPCPALSGSCVRRDLRPAHAGKPDRRIQKGWGVCFPCPDFFGLGVANLRAFIKHHNRDASDVAECPARLNSRRPIGSFWRCGLSQFPCSE